jgi:hypothetical protein
VRKPGAGLRFVDVLIIEEGELAGRPPRVETLSFKSRDFSGLEFNALKAQLIEDAREALWKYGETLDIRRASLQLILRQGREVSVSRIRLVYEGGSLMPRGPSLLDEAVHETTAKVPEVEVLFQ